MNLITVPFDGVGIQQQVERNGVENPKVRGWCSICGMQTGEVRYLYAFRQIAAHLLSEHGLWPNGVWLVKQGETIEQDDGNLQLRPS